MSKWSGLFSLHAFPIPKNGIKNQLEPWIHLGKYFQRSDNNSTLQLLYVSLQIISASHAEYVLKAYYNTLVEKSSTLWTNLLFSEDVDRRNETNDV